MESRLRLRVIDAGLPPPRPQWWLTDATGSPTYRLDLAWPEYRVGLEYAGAHHLDRRRQRADIERRNWLVQTGWTVVWATDLDIYRHPERLAARLDWLLLRHRAA